MNELAKKIAAEAGDRGAVSFARFMELALYCPVYGYYEKEADRIGRRGDFLTSVSVGDLFGRLLASQFAEWLEYGSLSGKPQTRTFALIEAGAHKGDLARDILSGFRDLHPELFNRLRYWIVEPSSIRRQWQEDLLSSFSDSVSWATDFPSLRAKIGSCPGRRRPTRGGDDERPFLSSPESIESSPQPMVIFCNELLDAMPVHRFGWEASSQTWFEWGVVCSNSRFNWIRLPDLDPQFQQWVETAGFPLDELSPVLPDGYTIELCPAATDWWREAASILDHGKLIAIDYGSMAEELIVPERQQGTLRAYRRHRLSSDPLSMPGEQDLTAHVNFTAIKAAGECEGLKTETLVSQGRFLTSIAAKIWNRSIPFGEWTAAYRRQFQTLTHPEHLGRAFRVLIQTR